MGASFTKADNQIMKEMVNKCGIDTFGVYLIILSHRNNSNNKCFPSISTLMQECNISKNTIFKKLKELEKEGYIQINSGKQGINNNYYFPREEFYNENKDDIDQMLAIRKKKVFKKKE